MKASMDAEISIGQLNDCWWVSIRLDIQMYRHCRHGRNAQRLDTAITREILMEISASSSSRTICQKRTNEMSQIIHTDDSQLYMQSNIEINRVITSNWKKDEVGFVCPLFKYNIIYVLSLFVKISMAHVESLNRIKTYFKLLVGRNQSHQEREIGGWDNVVQSNFLACWAIVRLQHPTQLVKMSLNHSIVSSFIEICVALEMRWVDVIPAKDSQYQHLFLLLTSSHYFLSFESPSLLQANRIHSLRWSRWWCRGRTRRRLDHIRLGFQFNLHFWWWLAVRNQRSCFRLTLFFVLKRKLGTHSLKRWIDIEKQTTQFYLHVVNALLSSIVLPALPRESLFLSNDDVGSRWGIIRIGKGQDGNLLRLSRTAIYAKLYC